jgi:hypothetical protein
MIITGKYPHKKNYSRDDNNWKKLPKGEMILTGKNPPKRQKTDNRFDNNRKEPTQKT